MRTSDDTFDMMAGAQETCEKSRNFITELMDGVTRISISVFFSVLYE